MRRPVHREHDGDGLRGARHLADGQLDGAGRGRQEGQGRRGRAAGSCSTCSSAGPAAQQHHHQGLARERDRGRRRCPAARPTSCCTCWPWRNEAGVAARRSTTSTGSRGRRRCSCDLKPGGRYVATDLYRAGGVPLVIKRRSGGRPAARATRSRSPARRSARWPTWPRRPTGQDVVRPVGDPIKPNGGFAILRGNLAPEGCVVKLSGHGRIEHRGPARVFESEEDAFAAVMAQVDPARRGGRDPQRGPGRRARDARDAARDRGARGRGPRRLRRAAHRRPLLGRHPRLHGRPRRARGAARRADRRGPRRRHDRLRRRQPRAQRRARATRRSPSGCATTSRRRRSTPTGVLGKYARLVGSASEGAVTG